MLDKHGRTEAMLLAISGKDIPARWEHDPKIQDIYGCTVAMYLVRGVKEIPK